MGFEYITALCERMKTFIEGLLHLQSAFWEKTARGKNVSPIKILVALLNCSDKYFPLLSGAVRCLELVLSVCSVSVI